MIDERMSLDPSRRFGRWKWGSRSSGEHGRLRRLSNRVRSTVAPLGLAAILSLLLAGLAIAQGNPDAAESIVGGTCANCHQIPDYPSPHTRLGVDAPSWQSIVDDHGYYTRNRLTAALRLRHYPMTTICPVAGRHHKCCRLYPAASRAIAALVPGQPPAIAPSGRRQLTVDHPVDSELVGPHPEIGAPECLVQRHFDRASG